MTTDVQLFDYGNTTVNAPDRETETPYDLNAYPVYPTEEKVLDHGVTLADTVYSYDQYGLSPSGVSDGTLDTAKGARRGNLTSTKRWVSGPTWITTTQHFFDTGLPEEQADGNGTLTTFHYDDCDHSFLTETDYPQGISTFQRWECNSAQVASNTDVSGYVTQYTYGDPSFSRITQKFSPSSGATTQYSYNDAAASVEIQTRLSPSSGSTPGPGWSDELHMQDDLGRPSRNLIAVGGGQWQTIDTTYDLADNVSFVTNPYYSNGPSSVKVNSGTGSSYGFDAYGRPHTQVATFPGHADTITMTTFGRDHSVTDENGNVHLSRYDSFGELIQLCEIGVSGGGSCGLGIAGSGATTSYSYDALKNLK